MDNQELRQTLADAITEIIEIRRDLRLTLETVSAILECLRESDPSFENRYQARRLEPVETVYQLRNVQAEKAHALAEIVRKLRNTTS